MSVFMELMQAVEIGCKCKVNLETKSLHIDGNAVIENGILLGKREKLFDYFDLKEIFKENAFATPFDVVEYLYDQYKYSMPTKSNKVNKPYFKAEDATKITARHMATRPHRDVAQMMLEGYVLLASMSGILEWENESHWFWQSKTDKDLVILKKWVSN